MSSQSLRDSSNTNSSTTSNPQRKILEDLQLKKQLFLKQGVSQALTPSTVTQQTTGWQSGTDGHVASACGPVTAAAQRNAIAQQTTNTFGSYTITDSSFGNTLIPVLPSKIMKLWEVESFLQEVSGFSAPKVQLEQYETPAHIAAHLLFTAEMSFGDIRGKRVADLGCGCGMLALGSTLFEPASVTGFDIDNDALEICRSNIDDFEIEENVELKLVDVLQENEMDPFFNEFETVLLNPPFGTKNNQGVDLAFLKVASTLTSNVVYSLHKSSTRSHVLAKASSFGLAGEVVAELRYDLPKTYKFHKKSSVDIRVDFIRFVRKKSGKSLS